MYARVRIRAFICVCVYTCMHVCLCVYVFEREREREFPRKSQDKGHAFVNAFYSALLHAYIAVIRVLLLQFS